MARDLQLTGHDLTPHDFYQVVREDRCVKLSPQARHAMTQSRKLVEKIMQGKRPFTALRPGWEVSPRNGLSPRRHENYN